MGGVSRAISNVRKFFLPPIHSPLPSSRASGQVRAKSLDAYVLEHNLAGHGASFRNRASQPGAWEIRFQLLLFSVRLKLSGSSASMTGLKAEIEAFRNALGKSNMPSVVKKLDAMLAETLHKHMRVNPGRKISLAVGPTYTGL